MKKSDGGIGKRKNPSQRKFEKLLRRQHRAEKSYRRAVKRRYNKPVRVFTSARVTFPSIVSIDTPDHQNALVSQLTLLRKHLCAPQISTVYIDLSEIERLFPSGTLLMVAEIESMLESCFSSKLQGEYPTDNVVEQLFQHIGLIKKLGLTDRLLKIDSDQVVHWLYASGREADLNAHVAELPALLKTSNNTALRMAVTTGVSEAVANSTEHAYLLPRDDENGLSVTQKWWMFAKREEDDICVLVCDLGAGIPRTLGRTWPEEFSKFLKTMTGRKQNDHQLIKWALKLGRSSTKQKHRGRGLKDIHKMVKEEKIGDLVIFSNRGVYTFTGATQVTRAVSRENSIRGTIVQWRVPILAFQGMRG